MMTDLAALALPAATLLKARKHTIAVAESSAGGLIAAALVAVPGASAYFIGGIVGYTGQARKALLSHPDDAFAGVRASTEEYALRMARLARERLGTTWAVSETGASGPTGNRYGDAAGHACIAVSGPVERALTIETRSGARERNMWTFASAALKLLEACMRESGAA